MNRTSFLTALALGLGLLAVLSCRRSDVHVALIDVPRMTDERAVRIVTNAALDEVVGQYDGTKNATEVDLAKKIVLYHEGPQLTAPEYQRRIVACLKEVGFEACVVRVQRNPPPPVTTVDGCIQMWGDRHTAVVAVTGMNRNTDANVVVDAISYARLGKDDARVAAHRDTRRLVAMYQGLSLSLQNIETAIACSGFRANDTPANLGRSDALPHGWLPVTL